jgi:Ca2+/Na+ antiporter
VVYFRFTKKEMLLFTFFLMGITIYFIGSILNSIMLEFGMAVGLVAVFTILRFRTTQISIKDMAYLFATIGISVINALRMVDFPMLGRFIVNIILILSAYILELYLLKHRSDSFNIVYENIDLLRPEKKDELIKELSDLTGRKINRVKIENVDYKKRLAEIEIYYKD